MELTKIMEELNLLKEKAIAESLKVKKELNEVKKNVSTLMEMAKGPMKVAQWEKVSIDQFKKDMKDNFPNMSDADITTIYNGIQLPKRSTSGSAGYDIRTTVEINLKPGKDMIIPTGLRAKINDGWVLSIYPRSGLGFKYRLRLNNTVGIIDADYYNSDNEGHIMAKISNESKDKTVELAIGDRFCQGVFSQFGITMDDKADGVRNGGMNSTGTK